MISIPWNGRTGRRRTCYSPTPPMKPVFSTILNKYNNYGIRIIGTTRKKEKKTMRLRMVIIIKRSEQIMYHWWAYKSVNGPKRYNEIWSIQYYSLTRTENSYRIPKHHTKKNYELCPYRRPRPLSWMRFVENGSVTWALVGFVAMFGASFNTNSISKIGTRPWNIVYYFYSLDTLVDVPTCHVRSYSWVPRWWYSCKPALWNCICVNYCLWYCTIHHRLCWVYYPRRNRQFCRWIWRMLWNVYIVNTLLWMNWRSNY